MKIKFWSRYLVYIILLFVMIYLREYIGSRCRAYAAREFSNNFYLITINVLITVGIGLLLGIEHLNDEIKKDGTWKINLPKIILVGFPSLYFSFSYVLLYCNNPFLQNIIAYPSLKLLVYGAGYLPLFQLILGYVFITSFYKYIKKI